MQEKLDSLIEEFNSRIAHYLNTINLSAEITNDGNIIRMHIAKIIIEFEYFITIMHMDFLLDYVEAHDHLKIYLRETIFSKEKYNLGFSLTLFKKIAPLFDKIFKINNNVEHTKKLNESVKLVHEARNYLNHSNYFAVGHLPAGFSSVAESANTINSFLNFFKKRFNVNLNFKKIDFKCNP